MRKNWNNEEVDKLTLLYNSGLKTEDIAVKMGRTVNSIESKLRKIGLMQSRNVGKPNKSGNIWREQDVLELRRLVNEGYNVEQLAKHFNRTEMAITIKVNRIGEQLKEPNRTWLPEEEKQFKEDWNNPELSISKLKKKYNRTWFGLRKRALILELGPRSYNDLYLNIETICEEMQVSRDRVSSWIKKGLKVKKNRSGKTRKVIDVNDLLDFLEKHQDLFKANKISEYLFVEEPQWLIDKRKVDKQINDEKNRLPYTNNEDKMIQNMFIMGKTDKEIAENLHRTEEGIKSRRRILNLIKREYQEYEIDILKKYSKYKTIEELAKMLPLRKPKGIAYKCEQLGLEYHISKSKCKPVGVNSSHE